MKNWRMTINIKDLLNDDESDEYAQQFGKEVAKRLKESGIKKLSDIDEFAVDEFIDDFENSETGDDIDEVLDRLYDFADDNRIWIG